MNKIYLFLISAFLGSVALTSCSDWNDDESLTINTPNDPEYPAYLENLRAYKNSDHKYIYGWFDNSVKTPSSRAHHMSDVPDSIDVVVLKTPANLATFEVEDLKYLQETKGTKVTYAVDYDQIQSAYKQLVKSETEKNEAYVPQAFSDYLKHNVDSLLAISSTQNFDGIIVGYLGQSTIYMSEAEKTEYLANQSVFFGAVESWLSANSGKMISYMGTPQFLNDKSILAKCKHIILNTSDVVSEDQLGLAALQAIVADVPTDRFIVFASTPSLDTTDKKTGYYGTMRAITEAAYWVTEDASSYKKAGLAIGNIQNDYYNAEKRYEYVRESINIITPAPIN